MKLRQHLNNVSIFNKISLVTIILIIVSSAVSSAFFLINFSENMKEKDRLLVSEAAERIESFMQDKYNMMYNQRTLMHSTDYISNIISSTRKTPSDIYLPDNLKKITEYMNALCYSDADILDTILFTSDGENAFSHSNGSNRRIYLNYEYNSLLYIKDFLDASETITVIYDEEPPYLTLSTQGSSNVITFIGKLYDMDYPTKRIVIGYLMINFSPDTIADAYNEIDAASDGIYIVVNPDSDIIYSNNLPFIGQKYEPTLLPEEDILLDQTISLSKIRVVSAVSDKTLSRNLQGIIQKSILVTLSSILCLAVIITCLHRYYKKRFMELTAAMDKISHGNFETKLQVCSSDEIGYLSQSFNSMSETLDTYIKKTYLAETKRRTAELYALQAQINPHFLANTIESIRMRALADDNYELAEMLANLGNLFHWMIQFHQDIVYLEDEIDYINAYLDLQKFRFGDKLCIHISFPPDTLYLGIPRFTIQPIVENSLTHGFSQNSHPLTIHIRIRMDGNALILSIEDDGTGIDKDTLTELQGHIAGAKPNPSFGVALQNVHTRIQLLFGRRYGLSIDSTLHCGTTIIVTLPALNKKEMEKYV